MRQKVTIRELKKMIREAVHKQMNISSLRSSRSYSRQLKESYDLEAAAWEELGERLSQLNWLGGLEWLPKSFLDDLSRKEMRDGTWKVELDDPDYSDDYVKLSINEDGTFDGIYEYNIGGNLAREDSPGKITIMQMSPKKAANFLKKAVSGVLK